MFVINFNETKQVSHAFSFATLSGLTNTVELDVFVKKSYSGNFAINLLQHMKRSVHMKTNKLNNNWIHAKVTLHLNFMLLYFFFKKHERLLFSNEFLHQFCRIQFIFYLYSSIFFSVINLKITKTGTGVLVRIEINI